MTARLRSVELRRARFGSFPCVAAPREAQKAKRGGARRDRTDDLMLAKHVLSQLSYSPLKGSLANAKRLKSGGPGKI